MVGGYVDQLLIKLSYELENSQWEQNVQEKDAAKSVVRNDVCVPRSVCRTTAGGHVHWLTMSTQVAPSSSTAVEEKTRPSFDDGDAERFSHYVPKAKLTDAMVNGTPVVALCGKVWVPSRNPEKFPVCPECKEIFESMNR